MIERRAFLRGLFAMPAVVAVGSLMPIRGIVMPVNYKGNVDALVRGLVDDGIWQKIDWLWDCKSNKIIARYDDNSYRVIEPAVRETIWQTS